jgi:hypothetical protein
MVDLILGLVVASLIWTALPARWWPVDVAGTLLATLFAASGAALLLHYRWARPLAQVAAGLGLLVGALAVTLLTVTAGHLVGLYGPVGQGGALILAIVAALILPYLVVLPLAQLWDHASDGK